jgi:hypothetical protein
VTRPVGQRRAAQGMILGGVLWMAFATAIIVIGHAVVPGWIMLVLILIYPMGALLAAACLPVIVRHNHLAAGSSARLATAGASGVSVGLVAWAVVFLMPLLVLGRTGTMAWEAELELAFRLAMLLVGGGLVTIGVAWSRARAARYLPAVAFLGSAVALGTIVATLREVQGPRPWAALWLVLGVVWTVLGVTAQPGARRDGAG